MATFPCWSTARATGHLYAHIGFVCLVDELLSLFNFVTDGMSCGHAFYTTG